MRSTVRFWMSSTGMLLDAARAASIWAIRSVWSRPGASPLIRTGTISVTSDLIRPASPGRMRFEVVRPGIGSRAELDRMTRIAGIAALAQVRKGGTQQADRAPQRAVDGGLPGGLVELVESAGWRSAGVDDEQIEPAECGDRGLDRLARAARRREVRGDSGATESLGGRLELLARPPDQPGPGALVAERLRDRAAQSAAPAADECPRARQSEVHRSPQSESLPGGDLISTPNQRSYAAAGASTANT